MLRAENIEESKANLRALLVAKAAILDRSSQEEVDEFNKMKDRLVDLTAPEQEGERKSVEEGMKNMFNNFFRDSDGKPKPINVKVGDAYNEEAEFDNYLKQVNKNKK